MPLFAKLNDPKHWRTLPNVWFRQIVICDGISEKPIQSVRLRPGMNIVWGQETPETKGTTFQPGHGLGKTTFCRLLRFCLGEKSFGQPGTVAGVQNAFPDGFVDAVIEVGGQCWCVRRSFSAAHVSFARHETSLHTFDRRQPDSQADAFSAFLTHLGVAALAGIPDRDFLAGGKSFEWSHLMSMCSRDQEARYVDPLVWRSKRSTAELPAFLQPKADAIRCVLVLLGIYNDKDRELDDREETLKKRVNALKQDKAKHADRQQYWEDYYREHLTAVGVEDAKYRSLEEADLFSLHSAYKKVHDEIVVELARMDQAIKQFEMQVSLAAATLQERREHWESKETTAAVIREPAEQVIEDFLSSRREWQIRLQELRELKFSLCVFGNVTYGKCNHIQEFKAQLEQGLEALPAEPPKTAQERLELAAQLELTAANIRDAEERAREQLKKLLDDKEEAERERRRQERKLEDIETAWNELQRIARSRNNATFEPSVSSVIEELNSTTQDLSHANSERQAAIRHHRKQLRDLEATFDVLVKRCITEEYEGSIKLSEENLDFQILHGETGSGEGFEMLAILLSDLALAVLGAARHATHPGLIVHDSPREADLGPYAYRHFLSSIHAVLDSLSCDTGTPIQYIVTTTTPPPKELRRKDLTPLRLSGKHGMLFGKALKTARLRQNVFSSFAGDDAQKRSTEAEPEGVND